MGTKAENMYCELYTLHQCQTLCVALEIKQLWLENLHIYRCRHSIYRKMILVNSDHFAFHGHCALREQLFAGQRKWLKFASVTKTVWLHE